MSLSQTERDLQRYTQERIRNLVKDVSQAFEIADLEPRNSLPCMGAVLMKTATTIATTMGMPKDYFMRWCSELYDESKRDNDDYDKHANQSERRD